MISELVSPDWVEQAHKAIEFWNVTALRMIAQFELNAHIAIPIPICTVSGAIIGILLSEALNKTNNQEAGTFAPGTLMAIRLTEWGVGGALVGTAVGFLLNIH
jgi:hypothetical protein